MIHTVPGILCQDRATEENNVVPSLTDDSIPFKVQCGDATKAGAVFTINSAAMYYKLIGLCIYLMHTIPQSLR